MLGLGPIASQPLVSLVAPPELDLPNLPAGPRLVRVRTRAASIAIVTTTSSAVRVRTPHTRNAEPRMLTMKTNDRLPALQATLTRSDGTAIDLTGTTVKFLMKSATTGVVKVSTLAVVESALAGDVRYDWLALDTDTAGLFRGEFEITTTATGLKETVPSDSYLSITFFADIA